MTVLPNADHVKPSVRLPVLALLLAASLHGGAAVARDIFVLDTANNIARVPESKPGLAATTSVAISGLTPGDVLVAIDVRPQNAQLYGLGFNSAAGTVQLYHIAVDAAGARAFPVGATGSFVNGSGMTAAISGTAFGMDFNPAVDRLRVVNNAGQNFRINPNTGAFIDGDLAGGSAVSGVNMDGPINGGTTQLDDIAYTNDIANTTVTTLYSIDSTTDKLFIQNTANAGTATSPINVSVAFGSESGFDIPYDVSATASNTAASGEALAAFSVGGVSGLYRLNLTTGAATSLGSFGETVRDIAIAAETEPAIALGGDGASLIRFQVPRPGTTTTVSIVGVAGGERLVGIAARPATGQLLGLGVNSTANTATAYLIDPQTGSATSIGPQGQIAFVDSIGNPIDLPDGAWGIDINPTVDRMRVVSNLNGLNFRVNPVTGSAVDGDTATSGVNPDAAINGAIGVGLSGVAYTNNVLGAAVTTLYTLDTAGNRLFIQNPANSGIQTSPLPLTRNGAAFDVDTLAGFDIPPGVDAPANGSRAAGDAFAALGAGTTALYRINLATGAVRPIGRIGSGASVSGLVVWTQSGLIFENGFELL